MVPPRSTANRRSARSPGGLIGVGIRLSRLKGEPLSSKLDTASEFLASSCSRPLRLADPTRKFGSVGKDLGHWFVPAAASRMHRGRNDRSRIFRYWMAPSDWEVRPGMSGRTREPSGALIGTALVFGAAVGVVLFSLTGAAFWIGIASGLGLVVGLVIDQARGTDSDR